MVAVLGFSNACVQPLQRSSDLHKLFGLYIGNLHTFYLHLFEYYCNDDSLVTFRCIVYCDFLSQHKNID